MSKNGETTRRSFLKSGAIIAAPIAAVAVPAAALADDGAKARLARLEDERAIGELHRALLGRINNAGLERSGEFFADRRAPELGTGLRAVRPDLQAVPDRLELAEDGSRATARHSCQVEFETALEGDSTLVQMARLQGNSAVTRVERRVLKADYVKLESGWAVENLRLA